MCRGLLLKFISIYCVFVVIIVVVFVVIIVVVVATSKHVAKLVT